MKPTIKQLIIHICKIILLPIATFSPLAYSANVTSKLVNFAYLENYSGERSTFIFTVSDPCDLKPNSLHITTFKSWDKAGKKYLIRHIYVSEAYCSADKRHTGKTMQKTITFSPIRYTTHFYIVYPKNTSLQT